ncbi:hypothetical protein ACA910_009295 [Epithemia clementina (nom. ined.)]
MRKEEDKDGNRSQLENVLQQAATWEPEKAGRRRMDDGTLPNWYEWSRRHPQKDAHVLICQGRNEWRQETQIRQSRSGNKRRRVSVVSWNILSDTWAQQATYHHIGQEGVAWETRFPLLLQWLEGFRPDVIALQEVDYCKYEQDILPEVEKMGYNGSLQKPKKQSSQQPCGAATFWDKQQFHLLDSEASSRCLCVVLRPILTNSKETGKNSVPTEQQSIPSPFTVVNVHLESSQSLSGCERRARQLNSALWRASRKMDATQIPMILCGDFNTGADSCLFHTLRHESWHGYPLASVDEHPETAKTLPVNRVTYAQPQHHYAIDHVFYSHDSFRLECVLNALTPTESISTWDL